jgi:uncharacterized membrane-anchored protein YhcB (DUF1043 family)
MFNPMPDFQQSVEMMKSMWTNSAKMNTDNGMPNFAIPGLSSLNPFGIPTLDIEELDKRIKDLKSVESWLSLNLNILQTTIQGLEVQRATLNTLQGIAETMKASTASNTDENTSEMKDNFARASEFMGAGGKLAQDLMEQMAKSMTSMMPDPSQVSPTTPKSTSKPRARKTTTRSAKTAKSHPTR